MKTLLIAGLLIGGLTFIGIPSSFAKTSVQSGNGYSGFQEYNMDFHHHWKEKYHRRRSDGYFHHDHDRERYNWHRWHKRPYYYDGYYRDYRYCPVPYPGGYPVPVPVAPSGVSINAHIWIP